MIWQIFAKVKGEIWVICSEELYSSEKLQIYTHFRGRESTYIRGLVLEKACMEYEINSENVQMYTQVCLCESVYICRFSKVKVRMESRALLKCVEWNV